MATLVIENEIVIKLNIIVWVVNSIFGQNHPNKCAKNMFRL